MRKGTFLLYLPILCMGNIFPEDVAIKLVMERYNKLAYPGTEEDPVVVVKHSLQLLNIVEVSKRHIVVDVWEELEWSDRRLVWNGQAESIRLPLSEIWTPDITLYNSGTASENRQYKAVIHRDGNVFYVAQKRLEAIGCSSLPDDVIECKLKFGSWTYDGFHMDMQNRSENVIMSDYQETPGFTVTNTTAVRNVLHYSCCPEPYVDITYSITLRPTK